MACEGLTGSELQVCQAAEAATAAAAAATKLAERGSLMGDASALITALAALAIPAAVVIIVIRLWPDLKRLIEEGKLSLKVGDFEVRTEKAINEGQVKVKVRGPSGEVSEMTIPDAIRELSNATYLNAEKIGLLASAGSARPAAATPPRQVVRSILWVDDQPENNTLMVAQLRGQGHEIVQVPTTEAALEAVGRRAFDLAISDLGRQGDRMAGRTLIERLRAGGHPMPVVIYTTAGAAERVGAELLAAGAMAVTGAPSDVYRWIEAVP